MAGNVVHLNIYGKSLLALAREVFPGKEVLFSAENEVMLGFANNPDRVRKEFVEKLRKFTESGRFVFYTHLSYDEMKSLANHIEGNVAADPAVSGMEHRLDPVMTEMSTAFEDDINARIETYRTQIAEIAGRISDVISAVENDEALPVAKAEAYKIAWEATKLGDSLRGEVFGLLDSLPEDAMTRITGRKMVSDAICEAGAVVSKAYHAKDSKVSIEMVA